MAAGEFAGFVCLWEQNATRAAPTAFTSLPDNWAAQPKSVFLHQLLELTYLSPCPTRFYCPEGSLVPLPCPKNFYCSGQSSEPTVCPPNHYCPEEADAPLPCPAGYICPGGNADPSTCPSGSMVNLQPSSCCCLHSCFVQKQLQFLQNFNLPQSLAVGFLEY